MRQFTLVWQTSSLMVGVGVYEAETMEKAMAQWELETLDCALIGVLAGDPEILHWEA